MFRTLTALSLHTSAAKARACPPSEEELCALCRSQIYPYALRCLGHRQDAEDATVETLVAALQNRDQFKGQVEPRLWLLGIARRKIADVMRRRSRHHAISIEEEDEVWALPSLSAHDPEAAVLQGEALAQLRSLVNDLPSLQREALLLQVVEELSIAQIACLLGRSESAINSLLGRARDTLRKRGAKYFGGAE